MSGEAEWRWADPSGQQRLVRLDELRAALSNGVIPPNAPIWRRGWKDWIAASDVPELMSQALAAANGIVPNIPPPPLFVVAAQSEFESHTPDANADNSPYAEPPPPPRYVPVATPSSQPNLPPPSPAAPAVSPSVNRLKTAKKQTMLGMPAAPPAISASPATGTSGSEQLKKALPQDVPPASRFGPEAGAKPQNSATVVGVPAIADPRVQAAAPEPKKSDRPNASPPPPPNESPLKRPTLILYGGAPQEDAERASSAPPIVATAPGAPAGKNAVTQAPPWDAGAVALGPEIPKDARLPAPSSDEISASFFIESTEAGPKIASPPKRASSIPPPLRPKSLPPPIPGALGPEKGRTKRPPPFVPNHTPSFTIGDLPTTDLGGPPLPYTAVPSLDSDAAATNQFPAAGDADATNKFEPQLAEQVQSRQGGSFLVHLAPLIARFPQLARTRDQLAKFEEGKPRFVLPVIAGLVALVGVLFLAMFLKLIFGGHGDDTTAVAKPTPSGSSSAVASLHSAPAVVVAPPPTSAPTSTPTAAAAIAKNPCAVVGSSKMIAPKALVPTGVEVVAAGNSIVVGFASGPKDGAAIALNPATLAIGSSVKTKASDLLKRVEPLPVEGHAQISPNTDKKGDSLTGRRTVPSTPSYDLGVADGNLAWAPRGSDKISSLWSLTGSGAVEALRGAPLDGGGGIAITYRRSGAIWLGVATGDKSLSAGNLSSTQGLGPQVGSPAIAASGNSVLAIWADRASATDAWGLRLQRWKIGEAPSAAEEFTPPSGGPGAPFMSPGVASLGGGRFLIVWTEGSAQGHQVRALTLGADGQAQGDALTISASGENAGQGQAAVNGEGHGVVAYLVSVGPKSFQVSASSISCPK